MKKNLNAPIAFSFTKNRYEYGHDAHFLKLPQLASEYFCNYLQLQLLSGFESQAKGVMLYEERSIAGNSRLLLFAKAILQRKQISFVYRPYNSKRSWPVIISPIQIKEDRSAWFVIGDKAGEVREFALHRIESIPSILDVKSRASVSTINEEPVTAIHNEIQILLDCEPEIRTAVMEEPIHKSQTVVWNNTNGMRISMLLRPDKNFFSKVLSFQGQIRITSPDSLRRNFAHQLQSMLNEYSGRRA